MKKKQVNRCQIEIQISHQISMAHTFVAQRSYGRIKLCTVLHTNRACDHYRKVEISYCYVQCLEISYCLIMPGQKQLCLGAKCDLIFFPWCVNAVTISVNIDPPEACHSIFSQPQGIHIRLKEK